MSDRLTVVTGAGRGLGVVLARELAEQNHDIVVNTRPQHGLAVAAMQLRSR